MFGPAEINGHAFCLGLDLSKDIYEGSADIQGPIRSIAHLMRGAIFRPRSTEGSTGASLNIHTLGSLMDMFHMHKATKRHDKVYALLGMSSDGYRDARLLPDYEVAWNELMRRLVNFLLGDKVSVGTCADGEISMVEGRGGVLGHVSSVNMIKDNRQTVSIVLKSSEQQKYDKHDTHWILMASAKTVQKGDIICFLEGASSPTIIRPRKDYFSVILIAASLEEIITENGRVEHPEILRPISVCSLSFLLI